VPRSSHIGWLALVVLSACASGRWVVVRVTAVDGEPLADATVSVVCPPRASGAKRTGDDGTATLALREGGRCTVTATRSGYATAQTETASCRAPDGCAAVTFAMETE
jgi:hypothetical protein